MPTYSRPSVYVEETLIPASLQQSTAGPAAAFIGAHNRGPAEPTLTRSFGEFRRVYGDWANGLSMAYAAFNYFNNGGGALWVKRVVPADAATSTRTLVDRAGTPADTLKIDAYSAGAWGDDIYVDVTDGSTGKFNLVVYYGGSAVSNIVERWEELSMDDADARYVESIINNPVTGSKYVVATDLDSGTAAPNDTPALGTAQVLASGANGTAITAADIDSDEIATLDEIAGPLVVYAPDFADATLATALADYCSDRGDAFAIIDPIAGDDVAEVTSYAQTIGSNSYAAVYYPRVFFVDPNSTSRGATRLLPPGGAIAGKYISTDFVVGPWRTPAGLGFGITGAVALETKLSDANLDSLNDSNVNAIRNIAGNGIRIMGGRTLKTNQIDKYISARRTLIQIRSDLTALLRNVLFEPNDAVTQSSVKGSITAYLNDVLRRGGLAGGSPESAFFVKCDGDLNTPAAIEAGQLIVEVGVALQTPAEFIVLRLGQFKSGAVNVGEVV